MTCEYDIMVFSGGIAGLWLGNLLSRAGYNVTVIESDKLGTGQTLASQGMIHGGQELVLKEEGKIGSFGASTHTLEGGKLAVDLSDCVMVSYNIRSNARALAF